MNPGPVNRSGCCRAFRRHRTAAFTLPEMMIATAIFTIVLGAVLSCHLFGVRMFQISKAKLGASDGARHALGRMADEIRSAKVIQVGTGTLDSFVEVLPGTLQEGNSIQVYPSTNTAQYVRYFRDPLDGALKRKSTESAACAASALSITNAVVFTSEDYQGNVLTNNQNNRAIGVRLQFYQIAYPVVAIGPGALFDYYQMRSRITRRTLE